MLVDLKDVLLDAKKNKYAVGLFNTLNTEMVRGVIEAAEQAKSPIIIGTAEVLLPDGPFNTLAPQLVSLAKEASVPVVVHFDHGLTEEKCKEALANGFTGIMFDGSLGDPNENIKRTKSMVDYCHSKGVSIEGEIGHVGFIAEGYVGTADRYTTVKEAVDFVSATGVDALAIAIGTAHGAYKIPPKIGFERLVEIAKAVDTPLVLHGGSGVPEDAIKKSIECGISKINVYTDLVIAANNAMREGVKNDKDYLTVKSDMLNAVKQTTLEKLKLFGSANKA